ncbi:response regulator transcription factor [Maricaulis maris]|uniref:LuxR family two component transcriptional regulator n=1 Tax=Maricaulis maris TaxID=74318 RepID=A0A495D355_9PROT|nr:response regulator transcription factor [Maricaulis maris]RKQ96186.1 LuxR family two component transcriptional regulator [Maricaulis maris]
MPSDQSTIADTSPISLVVIDDHALVRDAIATVVEMSDHLTLDGEAADGRSGLDLIEQRQPDIALVDFSLPDMTGVDVIAQARAKNSRTRFLILTGSPLDSRERRQLAGIADGFHHKENGRTALLAAIKQTLASPRPPEPPNTDEANEALLKAGLLTDRERDVVREIARGRSVELISERLGITTATVRKHRENIMYKLGVTSSTQLVRTAMQIGQY